MTGFEPNAILRGAQLTLVGVNRALQNPDLFTSKHYHQAALAVGSGILIRILIAIPVGITTECWDSVANVQQGFLIRIVVAFIGLFSNLEASAWDDKLFERIEFVENSVLQVPFFLMSLMRYVSPALDQV